MNKVELSREEIQGSCRFLNAWQLCLVAINAGITTSAIKKSSNIMEYDIDIKFHISQFIADSVVS